jgi:hypothetical protein
VERDDAEWLLAGTPGPAGGAVVDLLAAATAPARPHELAGEEAAVAAFRRPGPSPVRKPGRRAVLAKLLTVKVAAAFTISAAGGVALAAAAGTLPELPGTSGISARPVPAAPPPAQPRTGRPDALPAPPASPSLADLCREWAGDKHRKLDGATYAPLVTAAGGREKVHAYCARLLAKSGPSASATAGPGTPKFNDPKPKDPGHKDPKTKDPKPRPPRMRPPDATPTGPRDGVGDPTGPGGGKSQVPVRPQAPRNPDNPHVLTSGREATPPP